MVEEDGGILRWSDQGGRDDVGPRSTQRSWLLRVKFCDVDILLT